MTDVAKSFTLAKHIKLLISDVDGVMTDGLLHYGENNVVHKSFHVHDGVGLKLLMHHQIAIGIITASTSPIVATRMQALGIEHVYQGQEHKMAAYQALLTKLQIDDNDVAYIGDDLPDIPLIERVGLGIAVNNARHKVKQQADWVTTSNGGQGAVREVCELILEAQQLSDDWQQLA